MKKEIEKIYKLYEKGQLAKYIYRIIKKDVDGLGAI